MKTKIIKSFLKGTLLLSLAATAACSKTPITSQRALETVENGVSRNLAQERKSRLQTLAYQINLTIPATKQAPIKGQETISFDLKDARADLQLDFKEKADHLVGLKVNGQPVAIDFRNEHLVLPTKALAKGKNQVEIDFIAGDLSLNRNQDYLYTLLVPDRARTVFPCFDQPDLKATFQLTLTIPKEWSAIANGNLLEETAQGDAKTLRYAPSDIIPTYLFSFAAGKFQTVTRELNGRKFTFLHRETDPSKIALSQDSVFLLHQSALTFLEKYTQIPYPFQKFDFVAIPDFQYGGMEHVGAIQYKASTLFLDQGATQDQKISRSNLIAHETAHMWFGDLVTMEWFNDVWMKEVFANFMADKITQVSLANSNYDLKFLVDHLPAAYSVDRTTGANPIRQTLENLQDAGTMYGNIIYHKAPVMMRQLERVMGEEAFQKGLQEYLKKYANGNATWPDLIQILDAHTPTNLQAWNQVWVNEPGRPVFDYELKTQNQKIERLQISQRAEDGSSRIWPQFFEVLLVYPDQVQELTVNMNQRELTLPEAQGAPAPLYVLFNTNGQGYGVFPNDEKALAHLYELKDPVARASAYIGLYENMLNGRSITPLGLLEFSRKGLTREPEELNLKLLTGHINDIFWRLLTPQQRTQLAPALEQELWAAMGQNKATNSKKLLFKTYQSIALTPKALDQLYQIWDSQKAPALVTLTEEDYISLALSLAVRDYKPGAKLLEKQTQRVTNPDRKARMEFLMPALSADVATRDAFFASLAQEANREKESWVLTALGYLHHPLRAATSEKYLPKTLDLLEEIQLTGDIFFPYGWLSSSLGSYQTASAAATVRAFLANHTGYNPKLKAKVLQAADNLFRAEKLVKATK
ncbi:aminopeptidase [Rufibacter radiotolerans]|uniref:Aminopeptidase N n=1 Tax=Rufibacter radiotolerans TaxID=1379910 RepID=A0A0H4VMS2_9BACT|nr:M1 family aminopeptidase [Rufibacter radiotolerans]AKQ45167.1 aminopeptidase [Rufibacter radiotolerans]